ncbi:MAG TPA: response regulator transcription factor [Solirubrobacteraceae bacterium]|nr:response regulator transcription factor [Solirubrobacteraceae bacterium]
MIRDGLRLVAGGAGPPKGVAGDASVGVVLAENHASLRRSLRSVLDRDDGVSVLAEARDLATAMRHVRRLRPRVLLFDPWQLDESGIEAVRRVREQAPSTEIVVLTMDDSRARATHALEAGALGFVLKDTADSELPEAVRLAARGEGYASPRVSAHLPRARALGRRAAAPLITSEVLP